MATFNRGTVQQVVERYISRFQYMTRSTDQIDRANAELYRLAARAHQDLANDLLDPHSMPEDLSIYSERLRQDWEHFLATGEIMDEVREFEAAHRTKLVHKDDKNPARHDGLNLTPTVGVLTPPVMLAPELRPHVDPEAIEVVMDEMCRLLGVPYEPPAGAGIPRGLVRAEEPEPPAAVLAPTPEPSLKRPPVGPKKEPVSR